MSVPVSRYYDSRFQRDATKIAQGQFAIIPGGEFVVTTLGSCVAACIRDRENGLGGMNHFMLPDAPSYGPVSAAARYGAYAMELLINELLRRGSRRSGLEAKLFGAASMMGADSTSVGERNAKFAIKFLTREGIPLISSDLLGGCPRKVYFFPDTGRVLVRYLRIIKNDTIERRDAEYRRVLDDEGFHARAELF